MFTARNKEGMLQDSRAVNLSKSGPFYCPECGSEVKWRSGSSCRPHFYHPVVCKSRVPESSVHIKTKQRIAEWLRFSGWRVQEEKAFPRLARRADIYAVKGRRQTVIEIQHSPLPAGEVFQRTSDYQKAGVEVVWIFARPHPFLREKRVVRQDECAAHQSRASVYYFHHDRLISEKTAYQMTLRSALVTELTFTEPVLNVVWKEERKPCGLLVQMWSKHLEELRKLPAPAVSAEEDVLLWSEKLTRNFIPSLFLLPVPGIFIRSKSERWWQFYLYIMWIRPHHIVQVTEVWRGLHHKFGSAFSKARNAVSIYLQLLASLGALTKIYPGVYVKKRVLTLYKSPEQLSVDDEYVRSHLLSHLPRIEHTPEENYFESKNN
nr:competence protein CoiA family protein [Alkalicoccus urumqiensis]